MQLSMVIDTIGAKKCRCGAQVVIDEGDIAVGYKDDNGKVISEEAAIHMSKNRANCPDCGKQFCGSCQATPYHVGQTCEQHQLHKKAMKCRFCGNVMKEGKES